MIAIAKKVGIDLLSIVKNSANKLEVNNSDTGWFSATVSHRYEKAHNLGTHKLIICVLASASADGSNAEIVYNALSGTSTGIAVAKISSSSLTVYTGDTSINSTWGNNYGDGTADLTAITSGWLRVICIPLGD